MLKYCCNIKRRMKKEDERSLSNSKNIEEEEIEHLKKALLDQCQIVPPPPPPISEEKVLLHHNHSIHTTESQTIKNTSPLRYPGGKTRACKPLLEILQNYLEITKYRTLISPFFGGGSFEFFLQSKFDLDIRANDKFQPLYTFWKCCKDNKEELVESLDCYLDSIDKTLFAQLRSEILEEKNALSQGVMYFIINRCSFSGATLSGGFSLEASKKRFTESSIHRISDLDLSRFEIYNLDFEEFINNHIKENSQDLLFLDPPYYLEKGSKLYGSNGDLHEDFDHERLFECLSNQKDWIMTYNNCEYVRNLYKDYTIIDTEWSYCMNKTKASSEIVIISKGS
jgi:DNA adenine methylase